MVYFMLIPHGIPGDCQDSCISIAEDFIKHTVIYDEG